MAGMVPSSVRPLTLRCGTGPLFCDNARMDIQLNGQPRTLPPSCTIAELLALENLVQRRVAVEVNGEIVPRGVHAQHALQAGDQVEIVHALGGG